MIKVENLSISFENKTILSNINLSISPGETMAIFGKNGSGKSVLLKNNCRTYTKLFRNN